MWALKFRAKEEWNLYNSRTVKFKVGLQFYSRNYYIKGKKIYFVNSGIVIGEEEAKIKFFSDLKKDSKIKELEVNNDFFISVYCEPATGSRVEALKAIYNEKFIFLKPVLFDSEGWEEWEVASFDRSDLEKVIKEAEKMGSVNFKLLFFREQKIKDLMIYSTLPNLTDQQKKVFDLAVSSGYYCYPRKSKLADLAKKFGLSLSTFQFHLAKAEGKLMPFFSKKL